MGILRRKSTWTRIKEPVRRASGTTAARSALTAGATVVALSAASAVTSALRRKQESSS
jgi:hypothetical protein